MIVRINDIFEPITEYSPAPGPVRLLHLNEHEDTAVVIELREPPRQPLWLSLEELRSSLTDGHTKVSTVATAEYLLILEDDLDERSKKARDAKWEVIAPLLEDPEWRDRIFRLGEMGTLVARRALELGIQRKTIYRLLYRYWIYGQVKNTLLNNYANVGTPTRTYVPERPPGRRAKFQGVDTNPAKLISAVDKRCIRIGYDAYVNDKTSSIRKAYDNMLRRFYVVREITKSPEAEPQLLPESQIPTFRQFEYLGKKLYDEVEVEQGRKGMLKWLKDCRPLSGTVRDWLRGPCHQFEIDATVADIYLVNSYSRRMLIGRPVVYAVVDSFSGMITGLYVGLEGPSWNGARQALFNTFTGKVDFCASHGVDILPEEWPCHHLPHNVYADRGEMLSEAAEGLASGLKIELGIAPPYRPDWKAMVESRFGILNDLTGVRWLPGGVAAREKERGERDYRLDATLTLKEFTQIMIKCVLHYNRYHRQPGRLTQDMMNDGVEPTPIAIWSWALDKGHIEPNNRPDELIYLHLLPRERASVQKGGIVFRGMHYICETAISEKWFAKARKRGVWSIQCWYDPNSAAHIWIQGADKRFIRCDLRNSDMQYAAYRSDEIFDVLETYRQTPPKHKRAELESRVSLSDSIQSVVDQARAAQKEEPPPATKAEALAHMRENRAVERSRERENAFVPEGVRAEAPNQGRAKTEPAEGYAGPRTAQVIDLLKRVRPGGAS